MIYDSYETRNKVLVLSKLGNEYYVSLEEGNNEINVFSSENKNSAFYAFEDYLSLLKRYG